jgi:YihY family inner membrane protein
MSIAPLSVPPAPPAAPPSEPGLWASVVRLLRRRAWPLATYLMRIEVHTFAFSVAANAILSLFPFLVLLMTLIRYVFHSQAMYDVVLQLLGNYLPAGQDFVIRNLKSLVNARHRVQVVSLLILLVTSSGVFLPLEVALNKVWGFPKNRSYFLNQLVSLALAFGCGVLGLISIALTAGHQYLLEKWVGAEAAGLLRWPEFIIMKVFAALASIAIFFLIYWLLPNGKVRARAVLPAAIVTGILWDLAKHAYVLLLPWLNFQEAYGPFSISVTLMVWAFLSGMLLLAGAYLSAANHHAA